MVWGIVALSMGCRCGEEVAPRGAVLPHFADWPALVAAAARGDADTAQAIARDLTAGPAAPESAASSRVGAALGFVMTARTPDDVVDGVVGAAAACGACHADVLGPGEPDGAGHDVLAWRAVHALLFPSDAITVPQLGADAAAAVLQQAWQASDDPESRAASVLAACQECHAAE
jgi:hypothetical protein